MASTTGFDNSGIFAVKTIEPQGRTRRPTSPEATDSKGQPVLPPIRDTIIPFGKHKGRTLDAVASTPGGLIYLDKQRARDWVKDNHPALAEGISAYLAEPSVARELDRALGG
jgi:hypothetical protein